MKVLDITVNDNGESVNVMSEFSAVELQTLLQFAVNTAASIGLTAELKARKQPKDEKYELND